MVLFRLYIKVVWISLYITLYIHTLLLMHGTCRVYYSKAWWALLTQAKYTVYKRIIHNPVYASMMQQSSATDIQEPITVQNIITSRAPYTIKPQSSKTLIVPHENTFGWPLEKGSFWISSHFGPRLKPDGSLGFHHGIDLAAIKGTRVVAARSGIVLYAGYQSKYGNMVLIKHDKQFKTRYAHLNTIQVVSGDWIIKGSSVGTVGDTGYIRKEGRDGSHLHFEMYNYNKRVNPMQFLSKMVC